jgi:GH3 auxin-responsive promoter
VTLRASAANVLWAGASLRSWQRFRTALRDPAASQRALLERYLRENAGTSLGRAHRFASMLSASDVVRSYQESVPETDYDRLEPFIARVASGESDVMTHATVHRLAPSSGSTSAAKLLPQTRPLQNEFSRAVDPWIADLFRRHPTLLFGPAYWSITPAASFDAHVVSGFSQIQHAVPIGFDDDAAYLGGVRRWLVRSVLAVPSDVRAIVDPAAFRYVTLLFLVRAGRLRLLSVWHPSFLNQLLDALPEHLDRIIDDIAHGTMTPPGELPASVRSSLARAVAPDPKRAAYLRTAASRSARAVWPRLALVSCWGDGPARPYAERLARALPGVSIQRKGLIATEAIVSIPFGDGHPVAVASHFFEFVDRDGRARLTHELEAGADYSVLVTTGGGLYRYRLGDCVRVTGFVDATPSVEFIGREDQVSDRFGEKLSDGFVMGVLADLFARGPAPRFAMLAPEATARGIAYTLMVEPDGLLPVALESALERALRRNPHYAWCVDLGQLAPSRVVRVGPHADQMYLSACEARGQRLGDVKPAALRNDSGWERTLGGKSL